MKNVSKICLGLVTLFSLTACGKGTKVKREKFFEKCADIKKDNLKKAKVTFRSIKKSGYDSDVEQNRENYTGIYVKDEFGYWDKGSETNDDEADATARSVRTRAASVSIRRSTFPSSSSSVLNRS